MDKNVQMAVPKRPDTPIPQEEDESELDNPGSLPLPDVASVHVLKSPLTVRRQRGGQAVIPAGVKIKVMEVEDEDNITVTSERVGIDFITGKTNADAFHAAMVSPKLDVVEQVEEDFDEETSTDTEIENDNEVEEGGEFLDDNHEEASYDWEDVRKAYEKVLDQCQSTNGLQLEIGVLMSNANITPWDVKLALMFKEDAASEFAAEQGELTADEFIQFAEKT
jgi:hypothetical protein